MNIFKQYKNIKIVKAANQVTQTNEACETIAEILNELPNEEFNLILNTEVENFKLGKVSFPNKTIDHGIQSAVNKIDQVGQMNEDSINNFTITKPLLALMVAIMLVGCTSRSNSQKKFWHGPDDQLKDMISEYQQIKTTGTDQQIKDKKFQIIEFIKSKIAVDSHYINTHATPKYYIKNNVLYHVDHSNDKHVRRFGFTCKPGIALRKGLTVGPGFKAYNKYDHSKDKLTKITSDNFDQFVISK